MSFTANKLIASSQSLSLQWVTSPSAIGPKNITSAVYGVDKFVAVTDYIPNQENKFIYSNDGINWQETSAGATTATWPAVTYGGGMFVAMGQGRSRRSSDGNTWTQIADTNISNSTIGITYGNGLYVSCNNSNDWIIYSSDAIFWTTLLLPGSIPFSQIIYGNNRFVALPSAPTSTPTTPVDQAAYSDTGSSGWTRITLPIAATSWEGIAYGGGKFVAIPNNNGTSVQTIYSNDGINWFIGGNLPSGTGGVWRAVTYGDGIFVAVKSTSSTSLDFNYAYSQDGITWTGGNIPLKREYTTIAYGNNRFVALANSTTETNLISYTL